MEELILRSEEVTPLKLSLWGNIPVWSWIVIAIISIVVLFKVFDSIGWGEYFEAAAITIFYLIVSFIVIALAFTKEESNPEYDQWMSDSYKFIESLSVESYEIVYIKIDPEMTSKSSGVFFLGSGSIYTQIEKATPVSIAYKVEDEVLIKTFWANTNMILSEDDKPYVSFQNLTKDLGHGIEAGWYNPIVHLPRNFEFNDIK